MATTNPGGPRKQLKLDTVRVKNGQSLASIARSAGVSLTKLYELNPALRARRDAGKTVVYNNSVVKVPGTGKYEMGKGQVSSEGGAQRAAGRAQAFAARSARPAVKTTPKTTTATLGKVSGRQAAAYRDQQAAKKTTPTVKKKPNVMSNRAGDAAIKAAGRAASKIKF